jgi:hypothetical protein
MATVGRQHIQEQRTIPIPQLVTPTLLNSPFREPDEAVVLLGNVVTELWSGSTGCQAPLEEQLLVELATQLQNSAGTVVRKRGVETRTRGN